MNVLLKIKKYVLLRKLLIMDVVMVCLLLLGVYSYHRQNDWYSVLPESDVILINPYLAQSDGKGNTFVIDDERSRVIKINSDGQVEYTLRSNLIEADTFWYAEDLAFDQTGNTYILDACWDDSGSAVARECILVYDVGGKYTDTLLDIIYEDEYVDKHKLFALTFWENTLYYVESGQEGFSMFRLPIQTREPELIAFYEYENAFNLIQDYAIDREGSVVYALDKRGKLVKGSDGVLDMMYDTGSDPAYAGRTALYRLSVDEDNNIYIVDIKQNKLYRYTEGSESLEVYADRGQVLNIATTYMEDGGTLLGACLGTEIWVSHVMGSGSRQEISSPDEMTEIIGDVFAKTGSYLWKERIFQLSVAAAALSAVWLLIRAIIIIQGIKLSDVQKNGILAASAAAVVAIIIVSQLLNQFASVYQEQLMSKLYIMAHTISGMVDGDSLGRIRDSEDYMDEDYQALMSVLNQGLNREDESVREMYCNVLRYEDGQGFAIAYLDNSIGTYYPRDEGETQELARVYETGEEVRNEVNDATGSYIYVWAPVKDGNGQVAGVIEIGTTTYVISSSIDQMRQSVMITLVLIVLIVLFLFGEILSFFDQKARYRKSRETGAGQQQGVPLHLLRLSIFVTYMAYNVASSFLSVYAASFVTDDLGLPRELAASLPITLNMIFVGVTSVFCAPLLKRFSFRTVAAVSAGISMVGDATLFLGHSYPLLVLGLIFNGIGMGLITNSINMFIASTEQEDVKREGFSLFNAGSLSGISCGMMLGASLAGMLGRRNVFFCSALAWGLVVILFLVMGKQLGGMQEAEKTRKNVGGFLASRGVVPYMLLIQFPYVIINSFVFYYVPIYGDAQGFSENIVCLFLMLNSLCSVYLSAPVTKYMSNKFKMGSVYISSAMALIALLLFGFNSSVPMLVVVLLILGFAGSFAVSVRQMYFTRLDGVQEYGEESAMGVYNLMDNIGESAGPVLFGSIMGAANSLPGLAAFVTAAGLMNGLYAVAFRRKGKKTVEK